MASGSNLQELTVTCRQCGSASLERLGPREYRCNHCGAITVVSQEQSQEQGRQQQDSSGKSSASAQPQQGSGPVAAADGQAAPAGKPARKGGGFGRVLLLIIVLTAVFTGLVRSTGFHSVGRQDASSSTSSTPAVTTVDAKLVTLSHVAWLADPTSAHSSRYVGMLVNHSQWPVQVPVYRMTLYTDGIKGATAESSAPLARLMPGEYEPVAFTFDRSSGDTRSEIEVPDTVERAGDEAAPVALTEQQLVHEDGQQQYRLVGLLKNTGKPVVNAAQVLVMLFGSNHTLIGYGSASVKALRPGEQTAVDVKVPTTNVNPVQSYEYLVDATPEAD